MVADASVASAQHGPASIEVRDLTVSFPGRDRPAVEGVSLQIAAGERVAVLGPSGCGKTTLLRALLGAVEIDGTVRVSALDPSAPADRRSIRRQCGVVRQGSDLVPQLSGGLNALLGVTDRFTPRDWIAVLTGRVPPRWKAPLDQLAARHGVAHTLRARASQLSGGERHRLAVVRAVLREPSLIVADEPTTGLDPRAAHGVVDQLLDTDAATLIITTHDLDVAARFPRKVGIRHGRVIFDGAALGDAETARLYGHIPS